MSNVRRLSDRNFKAEVLKSEVPTLVDFWAPWCGPCRTVGPIVEQLAAERAHSIKVAKLNVDEAHGVASAYAIHSIPTLIIFKDGKILDRFIGVRSKAELNRALDRATA
ncbi:MAG: thioredoxin [Pirellulales bacterium]|nr:thioredoxin [Pirellulales bacterium]